MNPLKLAAANLRAEPLTALVNALLLSLGTAGIVLLLLVGEQLTATLARDARGIDLVLGAKGSPLQLVLSSVYHADVPTGNIPLLEAQRWAEHPQVAQAIPLALGDSYHGYRIVGTTPDYAALYGARIAAGKMWSVPLQAVLGSSVAAASGLRPGDRFSGAHGLAAGGHEHAEHQYQVAGILEPSGAVLDRLILTSLESVWLLHEHEQESEDEDEDEAAQHAPHDDAEPREITAMLLRYATPLAALSLPRQINQESSLQAAAPAYELTRLLQLVGLGLDGLRVFAGLLLLVGGFSVFAALYGALKSRRYDMALLRCLGATRSEVFLSLLFEGLLLASAGALLGFLIGHATTGALGLWLGSTRGVALSGALWLNAENGLLLILLGIGLAAAALPSWQAYRTDVAATLSRT